MDYTTAVGFPPQRLPMSSKTKAWRKRCVDFGDSFSTMYSDTSFNSVTSMKINYDLVNCKIHMEDMKEFLNPYGVKASFIPKKIQHYPSINAKLEVLHGEESRRVFDWRVIITNPTAISEIEEEKNRQVNTALQQFLANGNTEQSEEELESINDYFRYAYQDKREVRANRLLRHYTKELDLNTVFNEGFKDGYTVRQEAYLVDIVGGEPYVERINPMNMRVIRSGYSNKIEDADIILLEDYWAPGRVIDTFYDQLSKKDIDAIWNGAADNTGDSNENYDNPYLKLASYSTAFTEAGDAIAVKDLFNEDTVQNSLLPYDVNGNARVLRVYWKSLRAIKKVKSYDPETGDERFDFYPETYHCKPERGEEEETFWVTQAWEGVKIGKDIYVNMRPRPVQYNRLSNPSRCHFGIIGSIYPSGVSMVDIMKPYAYLYDFVHDKLNKVIANNRGKVVRLDFAKIPEEWTVDQWMYYLISHGIAVENSWNEGNKGASTGRLAANLNNATNGVIDASLGSEIQQYLSYLDYISTKMGEFAGISRQREGQISNRETVGGVERATLQSSHSTEWLFVTHENVKKRVLECILETAKIALKGRKLKFEHILSDGAKVMTEIDGDEFAECDYGLLVDNSDGAQALNQKLDMLAQAGLQNGLLGFSTIIKLYSAMSMAEKQQLIESNERKLNYQKQQQQQQEIQMKQQELQQQAQIEQAKLDMEYKMHQEDNEIKLLVARINGEAEERRYYMIQEENGLTKQEELKFKEKQLDLDAKQFSEKLALDRQKHKDDIHIKEQQLKQKSK